MSRRPVDVFLSKAVTTAYTRLLPTLAKPMPTYTVTLRYNDPISGRRVIQENVVAEDGPAAIAALRREYDPIQPPDSYHSAHAYLTNPKQGHGEHTTHTERATPSPSAPTALITGEPDAHD